eukprot:2747720-Rhodomonas_salina.1
MRAEYTQQVLWSEVASFPLPQRWRIILHGATYVAVASASIWSAPLTEAERAGTGTSAMMQPQPDDDTSGLGRHLQRMAIEHEAVHS